MGASFPELSVPRMLLLEDIWYLCRRALPNYDLCMQQVSYIYVMYSMMDTNSAVNAG